MEKSQKGLYSMLLLAATAVVLVLVVIVFLKSETNQELNQPAPQTNQSSIRNKNDLNTASADLDNTNIDSLDKELNQVDLDASTL